MDVFAWDAVALPDYDYCINIKIGFHTYDNFFYLFSLLLNVTEDEDIDYVFSNDEITKLQYCANGCYDELSKNILTILKSGVTKKRRTEIFNAILRLDNTNFIEDDNIKDMFNDIFDHMKIESFDNAHKI